MDVSLAPKLLAAALVGATATTSLVRPASASDAAILKMEWVQTDRPKASESLTLRAMYDQPTTYRLGSRTVEATPTMPGDGTVLVNLKVMNTPAKGEPELLSTQIRVEKGETAVVMGTTKREGRSHTERLFFLTVDPK